MRREASSTSRRSSTLDIGRVENTRHPDGLPMVQVRIPRLHGTREEPFVPTEALPWARVLQDMDGGIPDCGSDKRPREGADVLVAYVGEGTPVVMGTFPGFPMATGRTVNASPDENEDESYEAKPWRPPEDGTVSEVPQEVFEKSGNPYDESIGLRPTVTVWHKSYKGHTILVEDRDGHEFMKIIDRAGQVIEFSCPVTEEANKGNAEQRGAGRDATRDTQLPLSVVKDERSHIRIVDLCGQEILLQAADAGGTIRIRSQARTGAHGREILLHSVQGQESITIDDGLGQKIVMDSVGDIGITLQDRAGNKIEMDSANGIIRQTSARGDIHSFGDDEPKLTRGDDETTVEGNLIRNVMGNAKAGVMGTASVGVLDQLSLTIGGLINILIGGVPLNPSAVVLNEAMRIAVARGSINFSTLLGDVFIASGGVAPPSFNPVGGVLTIASAAAANLLAGLALTITSGGLLTVTSSGAVAITSGAATTVTSTGIITLTGPQVFLGPAPVLPMVLIDKLILCFTELAVILNTLDQEGDTTGAAATAINTWLGKYATSGLATLGSVTVKGSA